MPADDLTHFDHSGRPKMVDVSEKNETVRRAVAFGEVIFSPEVFEAVRTGGSKKGDVKGIAELAGVMGAKRTSDLIPLCHPLPLTGVAVSIETLSDTHSFGVTAEVKTTAQTGVEMEALTAVTIACLTVYDMAKAIDKGIEITNIKLLEKTGGKSGDFKRSDIRSMAMRSVDEAIAIILDGARSLGAEQVVIDDAIDRVLANDVTARLTQPPFDASAMDGYAVLERDAFAGARLSVIGEAPAGSPFPGDIGAGEAVRVFTGAAIPDSAERVIIQEDVVREGGDILLKEIGAGSRNIRPAGVDFKSDDILIRSGTKLHARHCALAAASNNSKLSVYRRPKVFLFSNGDELKEPGAELAPGQIINSNRYAIAGMVAAWGAEPEYLGCAPDNEDAIVDMFKNAASSDVIIPIGGASVGDYDFVKTAFAKAGGVLEFSKVAVKPGKPVWFGKLGEARIVGLPGNPASAIVCTALFVQPLVRRLSYTVLASAEARTLAQTTAPIAANGNRESYLRAKVEADETGVLQVTPAYNQDSSLLIPFAEANCLVRREVQAPDVSPGEHVEIIYL